MLFHLLNDQAINGSFDRWPLESGAAGPKLYGRDQTSRRPSIDGSDRNFEIPSKIVLVGKLLSRSKRFVGRSNQTFFVETRQGIILQLPRYIAQGYREEPLALACLSAGFRYIRPSGQRAIRLCLSRTKMLVVCNASLSRRQPLFRLFGCNSASRLVSFFSLAVLVTFSLSAPGLLCGS
jgi:hypothetical protein